MRRALRRAGALLLLLLWVQVGTANALPCGVSCLVESEAAAHEAHAGMHHLDHAQHVVGHHASGAKVSAPSSCGVPQLLVAAPIPAEFPGLPSLDTIVSEVVFQSPACAHSTLPGFPTPPPRS